MLGTTQDGQILCTCCGADFKSKPAFVYHVVNCLPPEILAREEVRLGLGISAKQESKQEYQTDPPALADLSGEEEAISVS